MTQKITSILGYGSRKLNRGLFLYLILGCILYLSIDFHEAYLNRINVVKDIEYDFEKFVKDGQPLSRHQLLWGIRYYKKLQTYAPDNSLYIANEGFCYYYLDELDKAVSAYKRAIALEPRLYTYHWDLAMIYLAQNEIHLAIDSFLQALENIPITVQYYFTTVEKLSQITTDDFSALLYVMNQRAQEDEETALLKVIDIYFRSQDYQKVIELGARGLEVQPQNPKVHYVMGLAFLNLAMYERAVHFLNKAIEMNFTNVADAYYFRSVAQKALGNIRQSQLDALKSRSSRSQDAHNETLIDNQNTRLHLNIELRILRSHFYSKAPGR